MSSNLTSGDKAILVSLEKNKWLEKPQRIVSFKGDINSLKTDYKNGKRIVPKEKEFDATTEITSLQCDPFANNVYYTETHSRSVYRLTHYTADLDHVNSSIELIHQGMSDTAHSIALDWVNDNLYWADHQFGWIAVQPLGSSDPTMYKVLIQERTFPMSLAVDPLHG